MVFIISLMARISCAVRAETLTIILDLQLTEAGFFKKKLAIYYQM
jgi:hypothetical protein